MTFDDVLPLLLRAVEESAASAGIERIAVVRDLTGRVRLAVKPSSAVAFDVSTLEATIDSALGRWFAPPLLVSGGVWSDSAMREHARLAASVLDRASPWDDGEYPPSDGGALRRATPGRWRKLEARLTKHAWTSEAPATAPWPLEAGRPAVATFFSLKGGVGRTTLLAALAWRLARAGKRVVVVDLDLEAPGLASVFGVAPERGVLDLLLDFLATDQVDIEDALVSAATVDDVSKPLIDVLGAGALGPGYFEKLARLDFATGSPFGPTSSSPVERGLRAILGKLAGRRPRPDFILLDARAGLHDLAGLSLHGLAHVDVLVTRHSEQAFLGLDLALESLARRRPFAEQRFLVVHSLAPRSSDDAGAAELEGDFVRRMFDMFQRHVYPRVPEMDRPAVDKSEAPHTPVVVRRDEQLDHLVRLEAHAASLLGPAYEEAEKRFLALASPEPGERELA